MSDTAGAPAPQTISDAAELRKRLLNILSLTAERETVCQACRTRIWFLRMKKSGKLAPFTAEGPNHFADCPAAAQFKGGAR